MIRDTIVRIDWNEAERHAFWSFLTGRIGSTQLANKLGWRKQNIYTALPDVLQQAVIEGWIVLTEPNQPNEETQ